MRVTRRRQTDRHEPAAPRPRQRRPAREPLQERAPSPPTELEAARRAGGPQDSSLYDCVCGATFAASVSASVACPRCGADQPW